MKPKLNTEWYETMLRVSPSIRILGIISMDNHNPREFYARMVILDESDYSLNGFFSTYYNRENLKKGLAELKKIKSWGDLSSSDYFDFALNERVRYANDYRNGSPTMQHAYDKLIPAMKSLAKELSR